MKKEIETDLIIVVTVIPFVCLMVYLYVGFDKDYSKIHKLAPVTESIENFVTGRGNVSRKHSHKKNKTNRRK